MKKLWANRWFRTLAGFLLVAALLAPVLLPAAQLQRQEPENPIREENIQPVNVLSFGETDGGTRASAPLTFTAGHERRGRPDRARITSSRLRRKRMIRRLSAHRDDSPARAR